MIGQGRTRSRLAAAGAAVMTAVGMALVVAFVWVALTLPASVPAEVASRFQFVAGLPFVVTVGIAALLALRRPENPMGWLVGGFAISIGLGATCSYAVYHWQYGNDVPGSLVVPLEILSNLGWSAGTMLAVFITILFPDGRLPSPRWRVVYWLNLADAVVLELSSALDPGSVGGGQHVMVNPIGISGAHGYLSEINTGAGVAFIAIAGLAVLSVAVRFRQAGSDQREQLKWFLAGATLLVLGFTVSNLSTTSYGPLAVAAFITSVVGFAALPAGMAIAILRYRLYDIDLIINRTLVYGALAAFITAVYVGVAVGLGTLVGSGGRPNLLLSIAATAVVAVAFQPVRERLQRFANRVVYGKRATPYEVLSEFSARVSDSYAGDELLPRMAQVLGEGTGAELAEVWLRAGSLLHRAAAWPRSAAPRDPVPVRGQLAPGLDAGLAAPVRHRGELLGALTVSKRRGESLTPIEEKLVADLAGQAGLVLRNAGLTSELMQRVEELRASRQRLVAAQDQERRRIERDIHDGAQQHLVAIKVKLGLAEALATRNPDRARATLSELKGDADEALKTLRDLARGIYPPLLADSGLAVAVEAQARRATVPVEVTAPGLGRFQQELEAAVYFCCLEALQNVQKYAGATRACVRLSNSHGRLRFEVEDDGLGFDTARTRRGSGLQNMADRLEAAGGELEVTSEPSRGTRVAGFVPVGQAATA